MRMRVTLLVAIMVSLFLGACSSVANKSADQMVRYAVQNNLTRDNQYNFEGSVYLSVQTDVEKTEAKPVVGKAADAQLEVTAADVAAAASDVVEAAAVDKTNANAGREHDELAYMKGVETQSQAMNQWIQHWFKSVSVPYSGAVDIPRGKIEIIPELRYDARNALMSVKLPMQVDFKQLSLLVDAAAVTPFVDLWMGLKNKGRIGDKMLRLDLPESWRKRIPVEDIVAALPKAMDDGYATIDKTAYQRIEMDQAGREAGASYRVRLDTDMVQNNKMTIAVFDSLYQQLEAVAKNRPQSGVNAEDYALTLESIKSLGDIYRKLGKMLLPSDEVRDQNANSNMGMDTMLAQMRTNTEFYLDRRGRVVLMRQSTGFPQWMNMLVGAANQSMSVVSRMRLHYTKQPVFTLNATAQNTIKLEEAFPGLGVWLNEYYPNQNNTALVKALKALEDELDGVTVTVE